MNKEWVFIVHCKSGEDYRLGYWNLYDPQEYWEEFEKICENGDIETMEIFAEAFIDNVITSGEEIERYSFVKE